MQEVHGVEALLLARLDDMEAAGHDEQSWQVEVGARAEAVEHERW
jgi:hypothetical protein